MNELVKLFNEECAKTGKTPILKVNKQWLDEFEKKSFTQWTFNKSSLLTGIDYEIDNEVETFKFVYKN